MPRFIGASVAEISDLCRYRVQSLEQAARRVVNQIEHAGVVRVGNVFIYILSLANVDQGDLIVGGQHECHIVVRATHDLSLCIKTKIRQLGKFDQHAIGRQTLGDLFWAARFA